MDKKDIKEIEKELKDKNSIEKIKEALKNTNKDEELEGMIDDAIAKENLEYQNNNNLDLDSSLNNITDIMVIENQESTELVIKNQNKLSEDILEKKTEKLIKKETIDDELKELFKKIELESEIDKLREDASKKIYYLDKIYIKATKEHKFDNTQKLIFSIFLKDGFTQKQDIKGSIKYLEELIAIGYPPAMIELGEIFFYGIGVSKNRLKAKELFNKANKYGLSNPSNFYEKRAYAKTLIFGYETNKDLEKAYSLINKDEHPFHESLLGHIFNNKDFSKYNKRKAITHWLISQRYKEATFLMFLKEKNIDLNIDNNDMIDSIW